MAIDVRLSSTWDAKGINQAVKDINAIKSQLGSIERRTKAASDNFNAFGGTLKKLGTTFAAVFSAQQATQFFAASIKGAIEDEKSLRILNKTLANMGFGGAARQVDDFISKLQFSAGIADDVLRPALNNLVIATGSLSQSQKLLQVALDVSAGSGRDLDTITIALAKAYNGNYTALKKLNLGIDESLIKNKDLDSILSVLTQKFAGASANAVDTYAGKIQILKLAIGEAQETIGYALIDALVGATGNTQDFASEIQNLGQDVADIIGGISIFASEVNDLTAALGFGADETKSLMDETVTFGDRILQVIPILGTYLKLLKDKGKEERFATMSANATPAGSRLAQQARKNQEAIDEQEKAAEAAAKAQETLKKNTEQLFNIQKEYADFVSGTNKDNLSGSLVQAQSDLLALQNLMKKGTPLNDDLVKSFSKLTKSIQSNFGQALSEARQKLDEARQAYNNMKNQVKGAITGLVNFGDIGTGANFIENLENQTQKATTFAQKIQKLISMGLNESAIQQVLNAGYDAGSNIADQIIAGGQTMINKVNQLSASLNYVAESTGVLAATQFYQAGIDSAQNFVDGIIAQINASAAAIAKALADASVGKTSKIPKKLPPPPPKKLPPKPMIPGRANGGPVTAGVPYIVGERGPELFMPSTSGSIMNNAKTNNAVGSNVTINVNAGNIVGSREELLAFVQRGLREYDRRNGKLNING